MTRSTHYERDGTKRRYQAPICLSMKSEFSNSMAGALYSLFINLQECRSELKWAACHLRTSRDPIWPARTNYIIKQKSALRSCTHRLPRLGRPLRLLDLRPSCILHGPLYDELHVCQGILRPLWMLLA